MTDITEDTPAPLFDSVPVADLPSHAPKGADPETIALGQAALSIMSNETAARDRATFTDRADAVKRQTQLKRAIRAAGGVADGLRVASQIVADADGYRVVLRLADVTPPAPKRGKRVAD